MILVVDNYDSFVHNLSRYFKQLTPVDILVTRNDSTDLFSLAAQASAIVLSPGPCGPKQAGQSIEIVQRFHETIPMLGVCLGHQAIVEAFGGSISRSDAPMHGKSSKVFHGQDSALFQDIPSPFVAGRYHSLLANSRELPTDLKSTATTSDHTIMAVEHQRFPCFGVQFHPESVLTEYGYDILRNFLVVAGIESAVATEKIFS